MSVVGNSIRAFKTAWFGRAARRAGIEDAELARAIQEATLGQAVDLGGGVFKKRLNKNRHRSIILATDGTRWIFTFLFAKQDRDNINAAELAGFRKLAAAYRGMSSEALDALVDAGELKEIDLG